MFWFIIDVLTLKKLGLGRPFRYLLLIFFAGCLIAGVIYVGVIFQALSERNNVHHVSTHRSH